MTRLFASILTVTALTVPAAAQSIDRKPIIAVLAAGYADMLTTQINLRTVPGAYEQNPLAPSTPTANLIVGSASYIGAAVAVYWLERHGHPRIARVFGYGTATAAGTVAVRNFRLNGR